MLKQIQKFAQLMVILLYLQSDMKNLQMNLDVSLELYLNDKRNFYI